MITPLTSDELRLVTNAEVLLTKNKIIRIVYDLLGAMAGEYKEILVADGLVTLNEKEGKISRGENYKGLPYVILDYPRKFARVDTFAIRTLFWWGNFFSITLQLSGEYLNEYKSKIEEAIGKDQLDGWYYGCGEDPWEHHFEDDNYRPIIAGKINLSANLSYLKISKKIPLNQWDEAETFLKKNFIFLIKVLTS
jgi:hypothetical protein